MEALRLEAPVREGHSEKTVTLASCPEAEAYVILHFLWPFPNRGGWRALASREGSKQKLKDTADQAVVLLVADRAAPAVLDLGVGDQS
jgi:hypothetical protein